MDEEKEKRKKEIEKEIESLNSQMKSKRFERYSDDEKLKYVDKQLSLFKELKDLSGFMEKFAINKMIVILEGVRYKLINE